MDFEEFKEKFAAEIKDALSDIGRESKVVTQTVTKMNESYEAITVTPEGSQIGVNLNMDKFFEDYEHSGNFDLIVDRALEAIESGLNNQPVIEAASLTDYEQMKDKLVMEVVSAETNAELLTSVPHQRIEDMAVVYRFVLDSNENGRATILATNNLLNAMGITEEQLHSDAMKNAPELKPAIIKGMSEVMAEMTGMTKDELEMMGLPTNPADEQMFVATVPDKINGAGIIAYEGFMDQASERIGGGDFFILPSSLHEILIVPDNGNMSLRSLEEMVKEVNATQVSPEDKLTDSVYHYDSQDKIFELGEKFVERQNAKEAGIEAKAEEKNSVLGELKAKKDEIAKKPPKKDAELKPNKSEVL